MKALLVALALIVPALPAFAQIGGVVIVLHYKTPQDELKTIPAPTIGEAMTMEECQDVAPGKIPTLKRQLGNTRNFPEFAGWEFQHATCQIYSDDLLSTVE